MQASAVSTLNHMLGKLLAARIVDRHNPFRFTQFERGVQRDIIRAGGGRDSGRGGDRLHRLPPCWCGSSAYQVRPPSTRIGSSSPVFRLEGRQAEGTDRTIGNSKDEQTGIVPNWNPPADTAGGQKWGGRQKSYVALKRRNSQAAPLTWGVSSQARSFLHCACSSFGSEA